MGALAVGAEAVEGGDAERCGEIAVAAAAGLLDVLQVEAQLLRDGFGVVEQCGDARVLEIGRPVHAAAHPDLDVGIVRLQAEDAGAHFLAGGGVGHAQVDLGLAELRHDVGAGAASDLADIDGDAAGVVGHSLDGDDLVCHLLDGRTPVLVPHARMRRPALAFQDEAADALARGDDLAAVARRLGDQHVFVLLRFSLDARARGIRPDLLVGHEHQGQLQFGLLVQADQVAPGVVRHVGAALHVVDAGAEDAVALAPHLQRLLDHADGVHRIEMREDQDAGLLAPVALGDQHVALAVGAGHALDAGPQAAHVGLGAVDHAVDGGGVVAGTFDLDPLDDALEDFVRIDGDGVGKRRGISVHAAD